VATSRTFRGGGVNKSRLTYRWRSSGLCAQKNQKGHPVGVSQVPCEEAKEARGLWCLRGVGCGRKVVKEEEREQKKGRS
jgi:hypothetical protein